MDSYLIMIPRAEAIRIGLKRFFTGEPCNHGHVAERFVSSKQCLVCAGVGLANRPREGTVIHTEDGPKVVVSKSSAIDRGLPMYFTGIPCKHGHHAERYTHTSRCCVCQIETAKEWYTNNKERSAEYRRAWREANKEYITEYLREYHKRWYALNREAKIKQGRAWFLANRERALELSRQFEIRNRERRRQQRAERRRLGLCNAVSRTLRLLRATPPWITDEQRYQIRLVYRLMRQLNVETGVAHHVDHIIPIKGASVCGLHVPWNLRVITAKENQMKGNKVYENLAVACMVLQ